jgi:hypothetical protein
VQLQLAVATVQRPLSAAVFTPLLQYAAAALLQQCKGCVTGRDDHMHDTTSRDAYKAPHRKPV